MCIYVYTYTHTLKAGIRYLGSHTYLESDSSNLYKVYNLKYKSGGPARILSCLTDWDAPLSFNFSLQTN